MTLDLRHSQCEQKMRDVMDIAQKIRKVSTRLDMVETAMKAKDDDGRCSVIRISFKNFHQGNTVHNSDFELHSAEDDFAWLLIMKENLQGQLAQLEYNLEILVRGEQDE